MRWIWFWMMLSCFISDAYTEEEEEISVEHLFDVDLVNVSSFLPTTVNSVSVISGAWLNTETDFAIAGPEPLSLSRIYCTDAPLNKRLGYQWGFNRPQYLIIEENPYQDTFNAHYKHASSMKTLHTFSHYTDEKDVYLRLKPTKGLTNCHAGELSARTNLYQTHLLLAPKRHFCVTTSGSGHQTYFKHVRTTNKGYTNHSSDLEWKIHRYMLDFERKPNGNVLVYDNSQLSTSNCTKKLTYNWIKLQSENPERLNAYASDGKTASYEFACHDKERHYLKKVTYNHQKEVSYQYEFEPRSHNLSVPFLIEKRWPKGRFQAVNYYDQGHHVIEVEGVKTSIYILDKQDFRYRRVKQCQAPVGIDEKPVITHRFTYAEDTFGGKTTVYDAYSHQTDYYYDQEHRLTEVERFDEKGNVSTVEGYLWDDPIRHFLELTTNENEENIAYFASMGLSDLIDRRKKHGRKHRKREKESEESIPNVLPITRGHLPPPQDVQDQIREATPDEMNPQNLMDLSLKTLVQLCLKGPKLPVGKGLLQGTYLQDAEEKYLHARCFEYDAKGNVREEKFYGQLTSLEALPLNLDKNPAKDGVESYAKWRVYHPDGRNLLHAQAEDNGKGIICDYYPETDLIRVKYVVDCGQVRFRQFYYYDENTTLIKSIQDDGSQVLAEDLTDVYERHITYFFPQSKPPYHLSERIEEKYWDIHSQQEVLLKASHFHYSPEGYLLQQDIFDANNQYRYSLYWSYDAHGNVTTEVNALGHTITREYDANDNLEKEKGPKSGHEIHYAYDYANRLIKKEEYHPTSSPLITHHRYDFLGNRVATINSFGQETQYIYDAFNRLIKTIAPPVIDHQGQRLQPEAHIQYDAAGRSICTTNACQEETHTTYNARGAPLLIQHPDGTQEKFTYYLDGTLAKHIAPTGTYTLYERDFLGRVIKQQVYTPQDPHHPYSTVHFAYKGLRLISKIEELETGSCQTTYQYDGAGRLIREACEDTLKLYTYDELNQLAEVKSFFAQGKHDCRLQAFAYDFLGKMSEESLKDGNGHLLSQVKYTYDEEGHCTETKRLTTAGEANTCTTYNQEGQPLSITDAEGQTTYFTYNHFYPYLFGQYVLEIKSTDPQGRTTHKIHDALGRVVSVVRRDSMGGLLSQQEIFYDASGKRTKVVDSVIQGGQVKHLISTLWTYHPSGQEESCTEAVGTPEQKITLTAYNSFSQKERVTQFDGTELYYLYDALGRLAHLASNDGTIDYFYTYNRRHQIQTIVDAKTQTTTAYTYDTLGNLRQEIQGHGFSLDYTYDGLSRPTSIRLPDNSVVNYHYNAAYLKTVERKGYVHHYVQHDLSGQLLTAQLIGQAGFLQHTYDLKGRFKQKHHPQWSQTVPQGGYDTVGRLVQSVTQDRVGHLASHFTYDNLDHLQAENSHVAHLYQTDSLHNRVSKNDRLYTVNALHQLRVQGNQHYIYDKRGNLREKRLDGQVIYYTYDALNRLTTVESAQDKTTYQYDALHRRLAKTHNGKTTRYLYQGQNEIGSVDEQGNFQELRVLGIGLNAEIGASILLEIEGRTWAPLHDRQGNVVCLLDPQNGQPIETYRYSAFGEESIYNAQGELVASSQVNNPWRFASKRMDPETGWVYFGRRYLDPEIGRWTTPDPAGFADGSNLYVYLHHNPLAAYDAYGLVGEAFTEGREAALQSPHYAHFGLESNSPDRQESNAAYDKWHFAAGVVHGAIDFVADSYYSLEDSCFYMGMDSFEDCGAEERAHIQDFYFEQQCAQAAALEAWLQECLCVDPGHETYQNCRSNTHFGLHVASIASGGYGLVRGGIQLVKLARMSRQAVNLPSIVQQTAQTLTKKVGRQRFVPNPRATGAHTTFRRDPLTQRVTHYETFRPQTNSFDPKPWESVIRFDNSSRGPGELAPSHFNKVLQAKIYEPHIHDPSFPGEIRPALLWEIPK